MNRCFVHSYHGPTEVQCPFGVPIPFDPRRFNGIQSFDYNIPYDVPYYDWPSEFSDPYDYGYYIDQYHEVGYLRKITDNEDDDDINSVLILYGKFIRDGVFKYYTEYDKHGKNFRMKVSKNTLDKDTSRELQHGDIIYLDKPLDARYEFDDECFD